MKINFRKPLLTLLPVILTGCVTFQARIPDYLSKHGIPKEFWNYKKEAKDVEEGHVFSSAGRLYFFRTYDLDDDGDLDVSELYLPESGNPLLYGFDINDNNIPEGNEMIVDDKMDGLNGNEIRFDKYLLMKNKKESKII